MIIVSQNERDDRNEFCIIELGFETEVFLIENCTKIIDSFSKLQLKLICRIELYSYRLS